MTNADPRAFIDHNQCAGVWQVVAASKSIYGNRNVERRSREEAMRAELTNYEIQARRELAFDDMSDWEIIQWRKTVRELALEHKKKVQFYVLLDNDVWAQYLGAERHRALRALVLLKHYRLEKTTLSLAEILARSSALETLIQELVPGIQIQQQPTTWDQSSVPHRFPQGKEVTYSGFSE